MNFNTTEGLTISGIKTNKDLHSKLNFLRKYNFIGKVFLAYQSSHYIIYQNKLRNKQSFCIDQNNFTYFSRVVKINWCILEFGFRLSWSSHAYGYQRSFLYRFVFRKGKLLRHVGLNHLILNSFISFGISLRSTGKSSADENLLLGVFAISSLSCKINFTKEVCSPVKTRSSKLQDGCFFT